MTQTQSLKNLIQDLELSLLDPSVRRSKARLNELIADNFVEFGKSGAIYKKADILDALPSEEITKFSVSDFTIKILSPDTVLATYKTIEKDITVLRSSLWQKRNENWSLIFHQGTRMHQAAMNGSDIDMLNNLSAELNTLYGFVKIPGDNFGEPAINSGPCGAFANAFYTRWNQKFSAKVHIVFIMVRNSDECWHVLIRLPNGLLFDGGCGVHDEDKYKDKFDIQDMVEYDIALLEKNSYGLDRQYPRYCPNFSIDTVNDLIANYLDSISI